MFGLIPFRFRNGANNTMPSLNDMFEDFFNDDLDISFNMNNSIKADVRETNEAYLMQVELPGVKKEDIALDFNDNYLTVSALRNDTIEDKKDNYLRKERYYGQISRSFYFDNVNDNQIQARFQNGVLEIILPKKVQGYNNRGRINIQ